MTGALSDLVPVPAGHPDTWPLRPRLRHAQVCAAVLRDRYGITTGRDGHFIGPANHSDAEYLVIAAEVSARVADHLRSGTSLHDTITRHAAWRDLPSKPKPRSKP